MEIKLTDPVLIRRTQRSYILVFSKLHQKAQEGRAIRFSCLAQIYVWMRLPV